MNRRQLLQHTPLVLAGAAGYRAVGQTAPLPSSPAFYDVRKFGATGDGKTVDTDAVNAAIAAVAAAGGGTLVFPAGRYVCFTIRLRSYVDLYLSRGAVVEAAASPKPGEATGYRGGSYDAAEPNDPWTPYQDYGHNHWRNSLFFADGQHDFSVTGPGLIDGSGLSNGRAEGVAPYETYVAEQAGVGNKAFALKNCRNVLLRDLQILKGGHFALLATGVDNLTVDNLLVDTDRDGFDIDCCRNVRVSNCTVNSPWDDAICPKSSFALGYARSTDNVTIANNYVTGGYELGSVLDATWKRFADSARVPRNGRIKCGTESNGGFRNITITGNVIEACKGIALESSDGAFVEDVTITGNTLRDIVDAPIFFRLNRRARAPQQDVRPGRVRRVLVSNLVSSNSAAATAAFLSGIPENAIEDVKFSNCYFSHEGLPKTVFGDKVTPMPDWTQIQVPELETAYPETVKFGPTPSHGFFMRHLRNLEMSHIEIQPLHPDPRPAFALEDVHRADFFAITAPLQPNFALRNVSDFRILWSRATPDATRAQVDHETL